MSMVYTEADELELLELLEEEAYYQKTSGCFTKYFATEEDRAKYPHWMDAFRAGAAFRQRLALCANQVGKTTFGLYEATCHLTGRYPEWWEGYRYTNANEWWIGGVSQNEVRDTLQSRLLGPVGDFGSGFIPIDCLDFATLKNAEKADTGVSTFRVLHASGGYSTVTFKSYEQGRESWQAKPGISLLLDEEPPLQIYTEALMRTIAGEGRTILTFTPMKGVSDTVMNFLGDHDILHPTGKVGPGRYLIRATWDDAPHLSDEAKETLLHSIPLYQRDARTKGIPTLGAGAVYQVSEQLVFIDPFEIPKHWKRSYGMDVGWNRTAAVWGAIDPDSGTHYIYSQHYLGEETPVVHAEAIKARGKWIPGCIDPASRGRGQDDGQRLFEQYENLGLILEKADNAITGPLWEIHEAMEQGRFKIFNTCRDLLTEFRLYRRDEKGRIVKKDDHGMDAMRYWWNTGRNIAITEKNTLNTNTFLPSVRPRF